MPSVLSPSAFNVSPLQPLLINGVDTVFRITLLEFIEWITRENMVTRNMQRTMSQSQFDGLSGDDQAAIPLGSFIAVHPD